MSIQTFLYKPQILFPPHLTSTPPEKEAMQQYADHVHGGGNVKKWLLGLSLACVAATAWAGQAKQ
jgi:hypothetical protein